MLFLLLRKRAKRSSTQHSFPFFFSWCSQERKYLLFGPLLGNSVPWLEFQETHKTLAKNPVSHKRMWISGWQRKKYLPHRKNVLHVLIKKKELIHSSNETTNLLFVCFKKTRVVAYNLNTREDEKNDNSFHVCWLFSFSLYLMININEEYTTHREY